MREEYDAVGTQVEHRATRLEKELAEVRQLITTGRRTYEVRGPQDDTVEMDFFQEPVAPTPVRFLYGGHSPLALRIAARSCDGWYPSKRTVDELATHSAELARCCEDIGRDFASLRRVVKTGTGPDPVDGGINRDNVQAYAELGFDAAILDMPYEFPGVAESTRILERVAERTWG